MSRGSLRQLLTVWWRCCLSQKVFLLLASSTKTTVWADPVTRVSDMSPDAILYVFESWISVEYQIWVLMLFSRFLTAVTAMVWARPVFSVEFPWWTRKIVAVWFPSSTSSCSSCPNRSWGWKLKRLFKQQKWWMLSRPSSQNLIDSQDTWQLHFGAPFAPEAKLVLRITFASPALSE